MQFFKQQPIVLMHRQLTNPVVDEAQAVLVDHLGADVRHPAAAQLRHAVIQHRAVRIARGQDLGIGHLERALHRPFEHLHSLERRVVPQFEVHAAAGAEPMAVGAVDVQVRAGAVDRASAAIVRVGQPAAAS